MSDDKHDHHDHMLIETETLADGTPALRVHGPSCSKTRAAVEGRSHREVECSGPAMVNSEAYREGYDAINWGGKRAVVGQA